jgi:hypothetical protein
MKTNRELNQAYEARTSDKIRPKQPEYNWKPLEDAIRQWVTKNEQT